MAALRLVATGILIALAVFVGLALSLAPGRAGRRIARSAQTIFCRLACGTLGIAVERQGQLPTGVPILLVANHISWTDILVLGTLAPLVFVARHDLAGWPVLGVLARAYGALFVERGRRRQIPEVNRQMAARMERSEIVALFPEATTGDGTRVREFHSPHFAAARSLLDMRKEVASVFITPAAISYTHRRGLPLGRNGRASVAWYGDTEFTPHLADLVKAGTTRCKIHLLEPISFERGANRKIVARRAAEAIRAAFSQEIMAADPERTSAYVLSARQVV